MRGNLTNLLFVVVLACVSMHTHVHTPMQIHKGQRKTPGVLHRLSSVIFRHEAVIKSGAHHLCWEPVIPSLFLPCFLSLPSFPALGCSMHTSIRLFMWVLGITIQGLMFAQRVFSPLSHLRSFGKKEKTQFPCPTPYFFFIQPEPIVPQSFLIALENEYMSTQQSKFS